MNMDVTQDERSFDATRVEPVVTSADSKRSIRNSRQVGSRATSWRQRHCDLVESLSMDDAADAQATGTVMVRQPSVQQPGNVDKIRDILFGSQMRDYEMRFARVEETLARETAELKESTRRRFESLEAYLRKELESLESRLKSEREERTQGLSQLSRELKETAETLARKISDLAEQDVQGERDLRKALLEQSQAISEELRSRMDSISATIDRRVRELRNDKTDRTALAALFNEVALRLNNEFQIPGSEE
jgi:DNA anti-recombination protein RmuC